MMIPRIVSFEAHVETQHSTPDAAVLVSGKPRLTVSNHYADPTNQFFAGVWSATRGSWRVRYTEHEFCYLLSGRVLLTSVDGESFEFGPGSAFVVPAGFSGTWEVVQDCRKLYAIFEPG